MTRQTPQIPSASLADIAFMLLIFFLVATTMNTDIGISKLLAPYIEKPQSTPTKERNTLIVLVNKNDELMVGGDYLQIEQLKEKVKEFITNPGADIKLPEQISLTDLKAKAVQQNNFQLIDAIDKAIQMLGEDAIRSKGIISLQNDRNTSYWKYIQVQNELAAAFNELRDEFSLNKFGKVYDDLSKKQKEAVKILIPQSVSEAEPKKSK